MIGPVPGEVRAEIVGCVLDVLIAVGSPVKEGETLVLLESMKMEIPVVADTAGVVRSLAVATGDTVRRGDLVATVG